MPNSIVTHGSAFGPSRTVRESQRSRAVCPVVLWITFRNEVCDIVIKSPEAMLGLGMLSIELRDVRLLDHPGKARNVRLNCCANSAGALPTAGRRGSLGLGGLASKP
jgi:hypothetical protein